MRIWLFFLPYLISLWFGDLPEQKFWICWAGSLWILLVTFMGWVTPLPKDRSFAQQFMRPVIFAHVLCASYMALSSIFFFFHYNGYYYFDKLDYPNPIILAKAAQCQQYYQLAHAALATGLTVRLKRYEQNIYVASPISQNASVLLRMTLILFVFAQGVSFFPFGSAFRSNLNSLSLLASLLFFVQALSEKRKLLFAIGLFSVNVSLGILSGMKSATLIIILFLGAHYYSRYRWRTLIAGGFALWLWFSFIPTISVYVRQQAWFGSQSATTAVQNALTGISNKTVDPRRLNWELLVFRSSEISMFIRYVDHVPLKRNFYNFEIAEQAFMGLLPRFIRPDGKSIDQTAMERVYEVGIVDWKTDKSTSAKPALVADAYMSKSEIGILITFFLFGFAATQLSILCEKLFGGYTLGSVLVFNGCFGIFQTGNCFENIPASILYGIVTMYFVFFLLLEMSILKRITSPHLATNIPNSG